MTACAICDGRGGWLETMRVSGEAIDADQRERECDACGGTGNASPTCPYCDGVVHGPYCFNCAEPLVFVERIAPGRIAA